MKSIYYWNILIWSIKNGLEWMREIYTAWDVKKIFFGSLKLNLIYFYLKCSQWSDKKKETERKWRIIYLNWPSSKTLNHSIYTYTFTRHDTFEYFKWMNDNCVALNVNKLCEYSSTILDVESIHLYRGFCNENLQRNVLWRSLSISFSSTHTHYIYINTHGKI